MANLTARTPPASPKSQVQSVPPSRTSGRENNDSRRSPDESRLLRHHHRQARQARDQRRRRGVVEVMSDNLYPGEKLKRAYDDERPQKEDAARRRRGRGEWTARTERRRSQAEVEHRRACVFRPARPQRRPRLYGRGR